VPLLYELDEQLRPLTRRYLGDAAAIQAAADAVRRQTERN
jgi:2,3-bisphosphoglycerate-dependent phosphoglycerate mutase